MKVKCINKGRSTILEVGKEYEVFEEIGDKYLVSTKLIGAVLYLKEYFETIKEEKMENIKSIANWGDVIGLSNDSGLSVNMEQNICFGEKVVHYCNSTTLDNFLDLLETLGFKFERKTTQASEEISTEIKVGDFVKTKKQHLHGREVVFEVERILIDENTKEVFLVPSGACPISYIDQSGVSIIQKRTREEIIDEIKRLESCEFEFGKANLHIVQESDGFYKVESRYNEKSLTAIYMTRETANMYVDELNLAKKLEWIEKETQ